MPKRTKQKHLSKDEIVQANLKKEYEKEQAILAEKRKKFIDEIFMPIFNEHTSSLEDAQMVAQVAVSSINGAFQQQSKKMKVGELYLISQLNKNKPEMTYRYEKIFKALEDQTIDDSLKILEGLFNEANRVVEYEMKNKKLGDFIKKENAHEVKTENSEVATTETDKLS